MFEHYNSSRSASAKREFSFGHYGNKDSQEKEQPLAIAVVVVHCLHHHQPILADLHGLAPQQSLWPNGHCKRYGLLLSIEMHTFPTAKFLTLPASLGNRDPDINSHYLPLHCVSSYGALAHNYYGNLRLSGEKLPPKPNLLEPKKKWPIQSSE